MMDTLKAKLAGARKSLTIWFNGCALALLPLVTNIQDVLPTLQQFAPDIKWFAMAVILGNALLRFKTNNGLEHK